jgi:hypothetical protein
VRSTHLWLGLQAAAVLATTASSAFIMLGMWVGMRLGEVPAVCSEGNIRSTRVHVPVDSMQVLLSKAL